MLDPVSTLQNIYAVARLIYAQVQLVQANKEQCRRLGERVKIIESAVHGLDAIKDKEQYKLGLNDLLGTLNEVLGFIKKFTTSNRWERWILKAGNYQNAFADFTDTLQKALLQLNLGLAAQQIINREVDKEDQAADAAFIQQNQARILELNAQGLKAIQSLRLKQQEQQEVLQLQMAAMQAQLKALVIQEAKPVKAPIDEKHYIPYYDLVFEELIATGSFGKVYQGTWEGQPVAIKVIEGRLTTKDEQQFVREVAIMSRLRHPNVTTFYGACLEEGHACLVMELAQSALDPYLRANPLSPEQQKNLALDIAKGLNYLHRQGVLHRDLKSANILINKEERAKLADFGLSKTEARSIQTTIERSQALAWQAPECFRLRAEYTQASDVYSFGVILWEIVTGKVPTFDESRLKDYAKLGERQVISEEIPTPLATLMKACWAVNPNERPNPESIIQQLEAYEARPPSPSGEGYYEQGLQAEKQKDFLNAFQRYQKAASKGYSKAKTNLGHLYLIAPEQVVPKDKPKAFSLFLEAAQEGHIRAMFNVATMLEYGDGIPQDMKEALTWYQAICKKEPTHSEASRKAQKLQALLESGPYYQVETVVPRR